MRHHKQKSASISLLIACAGFAWLAPVLPAAAGTAAPVQASAKAKAGALPGSEEFPTQTAAAHHCPGDTVVWANLSKSKAFHTAGSKYFGKTRHGAFVCEKAAEAAGYHASKR